MLTTDFFDQLPGDNDEAFALLEAELRKDLIPDEAYEDIDEQRMFNGRQIRSQQEYIITLAAFVNARNIDLGIDFNELMLSEDHQFVREFETVSKKLQFHALSSSFAISDKRRSGTVAIYILDDPAKARIRKAIENIKSIVTNADLSDLKKEALFRKLNAFAHEVDKDRTNVEAFAAFYVSAKKEAKELAELASSAEKIWEFISKGKELIKALPKRNVHGYLDKPQEKIEHQSKPKGDFDLDDEIPF